MKCPKCKSNMTEHSVETLSGKVAIDRCEHCSGIWFDHGELDILKQDWMSEFLDSGDPKVGEKFNKKVDVNCPRCDTLMPSVHDSKQHHIVYEICADHGIFMDAGEFTDFKHETVLDLFRDVVSRIRA